MLATLLAACRFHEMLLGIDAELAAKAREDGCPICGGRLHSARYPRKPHGRPVSVRQKLGPEHVLRFSFCCVVDGCRKRRTPPSVRFLGRQLFLAAAMIIAMLMRQRTADPVLNGPVLNGEAERLSAVVPVSPPTISRWRRWWRQSFTATAFWQTARAAFMPPVEPERLPVALFERFRGDDTDRFIALLRFLGPITGGRDQAC